MRKRVFTVILLFLLFFMLATCSKNNATLLTANSVPQENYGFRIWWSQGFLPEENEVIAKLVDDWEKESGIKAELRLIPNDYILGETEKAIEQGTPPDVLFSLRGDTNLFPRMAWRNQLADVSDLIEPVIDSYSPTALKSAFYYNNIAKKRSYYAVPLGQQTGHIHYWRNLLEKAGLNENELPTDWAGFWKFWQQAQEQLHSSGQQDIYGIGFCMSSQGTDTFWAFEQFLEAYNVKIVDENGSLLLDSPENRQGVVNALKQFTNFYKDGYVPKTAVEWTDSGNNTSFLESNILMTVNSSLSIPLTQKQDSNSYNKMSTDLYFNKIATVQWPLKPDQTQIKSISSVKQAIVFETSKNQNAAKNFLGYLLKPENMNRFLRDANKGRLFPVMPKLLEDSFWNNPADPHISVAAKQYQKPMELFSVVFNPAYSKVMDENIWAKAILSVIKDGVSPTQAADNAIADIKQIFERWM